MRTLVGQLSPRFDVIHAEGGSGCVDLAREQQPDVILLDMMMPGMGGADVLKALGDDPRTEDIPVIVLSALAGVDDKVSGLDGGAVDYIVKPVDAKELVARAAAAIRTRSRPAGWARPRDEDPLTGLLDGNAFRRRTQEECSRAARAHSALSVLLIDIDHMGDINEKLGHAEGDAVLTAVGRLLRTILRASDSVFRVGGDEFAVLLPDTDLPTAKAAADRVRAALVIAPTRLAVTASIGIADFNPGNTADEALDKAKIALVRARESGGDRAWRADDPRRKAISARTLSEDLTDREWAVLTHLARGRTEQEIARRLGIRTGTVRSHKARIRRKLHVAPNARLADFARMNFRELIPEIAITEPADPGES
jgi:diguanylate cyclase (GGDEF)-like protein